MGFGIYALAVAAAGLLGWYLLALATGSNFGHGLPFVLAFAVPSAVLLSPRWSMGACAARSMNCQPLNETVAP